MGRLILIAAVVAVAVWLLRRAFAEPKEPGGPGQRQSGAEPDELVRCAHCGVHLPRAESRAAGGRQYCSEDHAALGPRSGE